MIPPHIQQEIENGEFDDVNNAVADYLDEKVGSALENGLDVPCLCDEWDEGSLLSLCLNGFRLLNAEGLSEKDLLRLVRAGNARLSCVDEQFQAALRKGLPVPCLDGQWDTPLVSDLCRNVNAILLENGYPKKDLREFVSAEFVH
jgi:hypothetical protein